jgi:hypothetical protein
MMTTISPSFMPAVGSPVLAQHRHDKHLCRRCGTARARFVYRGRFKARRDHDLCPRCFRTLRADLRRWASRAFPEAAA